MKKICELFSNYLPSQRKSLKSSRKMYCYLIPFNKIQNYYSILIQRFYSREKPVNWICIMCRSNIFAKHKYYCQILGDEYVDDDSCKVEYIPSNSSKCTDNFGPITSNNQIGQVILKPYILHERRRDVNFYSVNYTVLNISFTNIKWKSKLIFLILL